MTPLALQRMLKGAPLSCLNVLILSREPVEATWLCKATGYSAHSVTEALELLENLALVTHDNRRSDWQALPFIRHAMLARLLEICTAGPDEDKANTAFQMDPIDCPIANRDPGLTCVEDKMIVQIADRDPEDHLPLVGSTPGLEEFTLEEPRMEDCRPEASIEQPKILISIANRDPKLTDGVHQMTVQIANRDRAATDEGGEISSRYIQCASEASPDDGGISSESLPHALQDHGQEDRHLENLPGGVKLTTESVVKLNTQSEEVNLLTIKKIDQLTSSTKVPEPSVSCILAASKQLFGEEVLGPPERYTDSRLLLASIAQAYTSRGALRKPARVVYANLKNGVLPPSDFLEDPCAYLPTDFLEAAGLPSPRPPETVSAGDDEAISDLEEEELEEIPPPDPSVLQVVGPESGLTAQDAWDIAVDELLRRSSIGWVKVRMEQARLLRFEAGECLFVAAVEDEQNYLWLQARVVKTLENILVGACNRVAQVMFVCG